MNNSRKSRKPISAESIALLAERGKNVSRFFTKKGRMVAPRIREEGSNQNVFADLGLPHPERELLRAQLTLQIYELIKQRDITQAEAAKLLGIKQPHVSLLMRNRAGSFSVERLMDFLTALGQDVESRVRPARERHGAISLIA